MLPSPLRSPPFPYTTLFRSGCSESIESGAPPAPRNLTNATRAPSGDQRGMTSRFVDGASQRIGSASDVKMPMKLWRSEEHTSELQSLRHLVCRLLLEKKKQT